MESFTRMKQNYKSAIYIWYAQPGKYKMQTANLLSISLLSTFEDDSGEIMGYYCEL